MIFYTSIKMSKEIIQIYEDENILPEYISIEDKIEIGGFPGYIHPIAYKGKKLVLVVGNVSYTKYIDNYGTMNLNVDCEDNKNLSNIIDNVSKEIGKIISTGIIDSDYGDLSKTFKDISKFYKPGQEKIYLKVGKNVGVFNENEDYLGSIEKVPNEGLAVMAIHVRHVYVKKGETLNIAFYIDQLVIKKNQKPNKKLLIDMKRFE